MSASLALPPLKDSHAQIFIKTQILTKPRPPPKSITFAGQTIIVTGSNSGVGLEASKHMLDYGLTHLIMGVRSAERSEPVAAQLRKAHPGARIDVWVVDHVSYDSVQAFVTRCADLPRLDAAVLNAGLATPDFELTAHGHETTFQVNYLSTVLLALLLLPVLRDSASRNKTLSPGRLTIVSSSMGLSIPFPTYKPPLIAAIDNPAGWGIAAAHQRYETTKLLELMACQKLGELVSPDKVVVNAVDPSSMVRGTSLMRRVPIAIRVGHGTIALFAGRSTKQSAWLYLDALAVKGKESHGGFVMNWELYPFHPKMYTPEGRKFTDTLWDETMEELRFAGVHKILDTMY